jgi:hypothetical protein
VNAPVNDTSALPMPEGQVKPGDTAFPVSGPGAFSASGGWALVPGEQAIRYTGVSGGQLTGIPASGVGAITAAFNFGGTITAAPAVTGVPASGAGALQYSLTADANEALHLVAQADDPAAQLALAALIGGDGVIEDWVQDRTLSLASALARAAALLAQHGTAALELRYWTHDLNTRAGALFQVDLDAPTNIHASFRIQSARISQLEIGAMPRFDVIASTTRFTLDDLFRRLVLKP